MERWMEKDSVLRIVSVFLAVLLWIFVMGEERTPETQVKLEPILIETYNVPPGLAVVSMEPDTTGVLVKGKHSAVSNITRNDITASVNLRNVTPGEHTYFIDFTFPRDIQLVDRNPEQVSVVVEEVTSKDFGIDLQVVGEPHPLYQVDSIAFEPPTVTVTGAKSLVNRVERVVGLIDIQGRSSMIEEQVVVRAVDAKGSTVPGVMVSPERVLTTVNIVQKPPIREFPVTVRLEGELPEGYVIRDVEVDPHSVRLQGDEKDLKNVSSVDTKAIDISNATETIEIETEMIIPRGTSLVAPELNTIRIIIYIEPEN